MRCTATYRPYVTSSSSSGRSRYRRYERHTMRERRVADTARSVGLVALGRLRYVDSPAPLEWHLLTSADRTTIALRLLLLAQAFVRGRPAVARLRHAAAR